MKVRLIMINLWGILVFVEYSFLIFFVGSFGVSYFYIKWRTAETGENLFFWSFVAALFTALSLIAHEAGHAVIAYILGIEINFAGISWWGAFVNIRVDREEIPLLHDLLISAAGPLVNIFIGITMIFLAKRLRQSAKKNTARFIRTYNIFTGLFNLLPIGIADGYWIVKDLVRMLQ